MDTQQILKEYIAKEIMRSRNARLEVDDDLLANGILDSLAILQLVAFIEERFNVRVPDEDVVYENFHTVAALSAYLDSLKEKTS